jgi:LacI family transcriptional regulator
MPKPTVSDVARHAGLSVATVHRVLGNRDGASRSSREKVAQAVKQLRFRELPKDLAVRARVTLRFLFILPALRSSFTQRLVISVTNCPTSIDDNRIVADIRHVDFDHPTTIIEALDDVNPFEYDGVALFALNAPGVKGAVDRAVVRGLHVVCIVTDIESSRRHCFVGLNNLAAGRVAGTLLGRILGTSSGKVGVVLASLSMRDQHDRYLGFEERLRQRFPRLRLLPVIAGDGDRSKNFKLVSRLLAGHSDLVGLYSAGSGNTGILDALKTAESASRIAFVMHELSGVARDGLADGVIDAVINQNTDRIVASAARILRAIRMHRPINLSQERIDIEIYLEDNLPEVL